MFKGLGFEIVTCGKIRDGEKRIVNIQEGNAKGKTVVIVDDLVQTGGILIICVVIFLSLCLIGCSLRFTCRGQTF
jgi:phosphoribosylpyrophosphate synthetase